MSEGPDLTIAITVYDRREFIGQAINSALKQTRPAKVIVVEDCGPDEGLQESVTREFGSAISYHRNPRRRGLFDNWNACLELCTTPYLSILHDDDYLLPNFVETMAWMRSEAPGLGLYFGAFRAVKSTGETVPYPREEIDRPIAPIDLPKLAWNNTLGFGGHALSVAAVKALGGFQKGSWFSGDWNMWFRLTAAAGGVHTGTEVICARVYLNPTKGSFRVMYAGRDHAGTILQRKRNFAWLRKAGQGPAVTIDQIRGASRPGLRKLLKYGADFAPRMLPYNLALLRRSAPRGLRETVSWSLAHLITPEIARAASKIWRRGHEWMQGPRHDQSLRGD